MKKYKHKYTEDIVEECVNCYRTKDGLIIPCNIIEKGSDWQEIIEKDYEILSFIVKTHNSILIKDTTNRFWYNSQQLYYDESKLLSNSSYLIYSVKRLSDGEVFTIGDQVVETSYGSRDCSITKINLINNNIQLEFTKYASTDLYQPTILLRNVKWCYSRTSINHKSSRCGTGSSWRNLREFLYLKQKME